MCFVKLNRRRGSERRNEWKVKWENKKDTGETFLYFIMLPYQNVCRTQFIVYLALSLQSNVANNKGFGNDSKCFWIVEFEWLLRASSKRINNKLFLKRISSLFQMHNRNICIKSYFFELVDGGGAVVAFVVFLSSLFRFDYFSLRVFVFYFNGVLDTMGSLKIQWPIEIQLDFITIVRFTCLLEHSMFWCQFLFNFIWYDFLLSFLFLS